MFRSYLINGIYERFLDCRAYFIGSQHEASVNLAIFQMASHYDVVIVLALLGLMTAMFLSSLIPVDLAAIFTLLCATALGYVLPDEVFSGISSSAVMILVAMFVLASALKRSGAANWVAEGASKLVGTSMRGNIALVYFLSMFISAFMNNVAAAAILLPSVLAISQRSSVPPSRLFMPLAFGILFGGMTTLIGTSSNLVSSDILQGSGIAGFAFTDFTAISLCIALACGAVIILGTPYLLPHRNPSQVVRRRTADLAKLYALSERVFGLRLNQNCSLHERTIGELQLGNVLGVRVVGLVRGGKQSLYASSGESLRDGDLLIVQGRETFVSDLLRFGGITVKPLGVEALTRDLPGIITGAAKVKSHAILGRTVRELKFFDRFGVVVLGIERNGEILFQALADEMLREDETIYFLGLPGVVDALNTGDELVPVERQEAPLQSIAAHFFSIDIPPDSSLVGRLVRETQLGEVLGVRVVGIKRGQDVILALHGEERMKAGDILLATGEMSKLGELGQIRGLSVESVSGEAEFESQHIGITEVVLSPHTTASGKTLGEINFGQQYGLQVLALWRENRPIRSRLGQFRLRVGDALLLQGPRSNIARLENDPEFLVLSETGREYIHPWRAVAAIAGFLVVILLSVLKLQPIPVAAWLGAMVVLLPRVVTLDQVYRDMEWRVAVTVAALLPFGAALQRLGLGEMLGPSIQDISLRVAPWVVVLILALASSLISQVLDGVVAAVLMTPIAIGIAEAGHFNSHALVMTVALSASIAFMTPFSNKVNLLVMGVGGYRPVDYLKIGTVVTVVAIALLTILIPIFFPLH